MIGDAIFLLLIAILYLIMGYYEIREVWRDATNYKKR